MRGYSLHSPLVGSVGGWGGDDIEAKFFENRDKFVHLLGRAVVANKTVQSLTNSDAKVIWTSARSRLFSRENPSVSVDQSHLLLGENWL